MWTKLFKSWQAVSRLLKLVKVVKVSGCQGKNGNLGVKVPVTNGTMHGMIHRKFFHWSRIAHRKRGCLKLIAREKKCGHKDTF